MTQHLERPELLSTAATKALDKLQQAHPELLALWPTERQHELETVIGLSDFIASSLVCDGALLPWLAEHLDDKEHSEQYRQQLEQKLTTGR